jgi:hypothetical protein
LIGEFDENSDLLLIVSLKLPYVMAAKLPQPRDVENGSRMAFEGLRRKTANLLFI